MEAEVEVDTDAGAVVAVGVAEAEEEVDTDLGAVVAQLIRALANARPTVSL